MKSRLGVIVVIIFVVAGITVYIGNKDTEKGTGTISNVDEGSIREVDDPPAGYEVCASTSGGPSIEIEGEPSSVEKCKQVCSSEIVVVRPRSQECYDCDTVYFCKK